jgi:tyrosinase
MMSPAITLADTGATRKRGFEMAVVRHNVLTTPGVRADYIRGVKLLKRENVTAQTTVFGIPGPANPISTYDLFVIWHVLAMRTPIPPGGNPRVRNSAHGGPAFLPWHRLMLAGLEKQLQRVLNDSNFGLPYWDWSIDASLIGGPQSSLLWQDRADTMGGGGMPINTGPFVFNEADPTSFRVLIETDMNGALRQTRRGLRRRLGVDVPTLPTGQNVLAAFNTLPPPFGEPSLTTYDFEPWDSQRSTRGFRNRLEGWQDTGPGWIGMGLHNQVHVWVGGDMGPASSPNDPVFFLHHCNVDRLWERWMNINGRNYLPDMSAPATLLGHRIDDPLVSPFGLSGTPRNQLDVSAQYTYDLLP